MRLCQREGLPLQPLHLQELQLLILVRECTLGSLPGVHFNFTMKSLPVLLCSSFAVSAVSVPATAQSMPGMTMPMPAKPTAKKVVPKKASKKPAAGKKAEKAPPKSAPKEEAAPTPMEGMNMPAAHDGMKMPAQPNSAASPSSMTMEHSQTGESQMGAMPMPMGAHGGHEMSMTGALGSYPMQRESSGTAWQPDASRHAGLMTTSGDWMLMAHGTLNLVYDHQSGRRGDDKAFASGMLMGMASRPLGNGTLQFRAMLSPDPLMGPSGYPLLLASGETANGRDLLVDRQHPHDFFMELSASASQNIGAKSSVFLYAGLPGEPAFGPPTFMHRESIMDSPEAPITHHWLDSTHITFGVVTAGLVLDQVKLEASRFNGREPDQHRWNIETGPLDSSSLRISWNPTRTLALQGSWAHLVDPEQLEPGVDQIRWSASALWASDVALGWHAAGMLAWGRKSSDGHSDDALAAEASLRHAGWTFFSRAEMAQNRELLGLAGSSPAYRVGKISVGAVRDFPIAEHFSLGAGGLFAVNFVPKPLDALYGSANPVGVMGFIRLTLN